MRRARTAWMMYRMLRGWPTRWAGVRPNGHIRAAIKGVGAAFGYRPYVSGSRWFKGASDGPLHVS